MTFIVIGVLLIAGVAVGLTRRDRALKAYSEALDAYHKTLSSYGETLDGWHRLLKDESRICQDCGASGARKFYRLHRPPSYDSPEDAEILPDEVFLCLDCATDRWYDDYE